MMNIKVRTVRESDKDFVLEYTRHTWEHGDYIPEVWDIWIKDTAGKFLTAVVDGKPVGILHISFLTSKIAWLEGARVHPKFRGKGIGSALTRAAINWCIEKGIKIVGFTTADDNTPAHRVAEKLNFSLKGRWYFAGLDLEKFKISEQNISSSTRFANTADFEDVLIFLSNDEGFLEVGKEYMRIFESFPLTSEYLLTKIHEGKVVLNYDSTNVINAVGIYDFSRNWEDNKLTIYFGLLTGSKDGILNIIQYVFSQFEEHKLKRFSLRLPVTETTKSVLENIPLRKEPRIFRIYERYL